MLNLTCKLAVLTVCCCSVQVTTDWLTMDMQDGLLDETIWKELLTDCDLDPWTRPQVSKLSVVLCVRL